MGVPTVFVNGERFGQGRMELAEIVAKVDTGAAAREAAKISAKEAFDVLVVGGGPAGAAAAIYAARKGIRTGIAAERLGGQVLDTVDIENFISVSKTDGPKLAAAMAAHIRDYEVDVMNQQTGASCVPASHRGRPDRSAHRLGRGAQVQDRDPVDRRALAQHERARRGAVPHQGRDLLPALRRPPVQGQATWR